MIGVSLLPDRGEDFVHDVLGVFVVVQHFEGGGKDQGRVFLRQFGEGLLVTGSDAVHEFSFGVAVGRGLGFSAHRREGVSVMTKVCL